MNEFATTANFKIDEGFKNLIPPLTSEELSTLEQECKDYGIRDALVVACFPGSDGLVLIDGHNRYDIARRNNLAFKTERLDMQSREDAEAWIIRNQLGRRNIPNYVKAELALKLKSAIAEKAKENLHQGQEPLQKSVNPVNTQKELAKVAGVSHDTIHKVEVIKEKANELDPRTIEDLRRGDVSINKVYTDIIAMEHEDRRQREARELREAKHRAKDYQGASEKVTSFTDAKQHKNDNELIFKDFKDEVRKMYMGILSTASSADNPVTMNAIQTTDRRELIALNDKLSESYRTILKLQRKIVEVLDEK